MPSPPAGFEFQTSCRSWHAVGKSTAQSSPTAAAHTTTYPSPRRVPGQSQPSRPHRRNSRIRSADAGRTDPTPPRTGCISKHPRHSPPRHPPSTIQPSRRSQWFVRPSPSASSPDRPGPLPSTSRYRTRPIQRAANRIAAGRPPRTRGIAGKLNQWYDVHRSASALRWYSPSPGAR